MARTVLGRDAAGVVIDITVDGDTGAVGGSGAHPDLAAHTTLGLSASHAHDYSASGHNHAGVYEPTHTHPYAATSHAHLDADIPAAIARDAEVTAEIATHAATPHGGSLPAGLIVMWGGLVANIPSGWLLCDGQNGTPDLRSRFVKGAAAGADPGATGGSATHTHAGHSDHAALTHAGAAVADHASHTHTYTQVVNHVHVQNTNSAATGSLVGSTPDTSTNTSVASGYSTANPTGGVATGTTNGPGAALTHSVTQPDQHSAQAHSAHDSPNSEPAYFALCFIQKV